MVVRSASLAVSSYNFRGAGQSLMAGTNRQLELVSRKGKLTIHVAGLDLLGDTMT